VSPGGDGTFPGVWGMRTVEGILMLNPASPQLTHNGQRATSVAALLRAYGGGVFITSGLVKPYP
jgi:hypothetical protein